MITITRHPDMFHMVIINDAPALLRDARPLVGVAALNLLWTGQADVLMVDPLPEPAPGADGFIEPDEYEFVRLLNSVTR